jgi:hypothetical protein
MKYKLVLFIICIILSCKKESALTVIATPAGSSNIIEGDIIWGGTNRTHFINQPYLLSSIYAYFDLDTAYASNSRYQIRITGFENDTIITFTILNPNLNTPGVFNLQDLDSNHFVSAGLESGYDMGGYPPEVSYYGISFSNKGQLTIDTISENHVSGYLDTYCNRENLVTNIPDTNEVHLLLHFSGDLRRD